MEALVAAAVARFGSIDVLINNAGIMPISRLDVLDIDAWNAMIDTNIKGVLYAIAAALPRMKAQKSGHIISIASVAGAKDTVLVAGTMSKTYAMTGWRIGFALAPTPIIGAMAKLQSHSTSNPT